MELMNMCIKFQYPSKRVILPDRISHHVPNGVAKEMFQYPSKRVILPDTICVISSAADSYKAVCDSGHFDT